MEEIKKIEVQGQQYGVADMLMRGVMGGNAQVIEWSHTNNMNDYKEAGTYRIKGERTGNPLSDNLPIMNQGSGHTIDGILYVLDSSLANGSGKEDDCTITQFLMLSNRVGGQEGDMYMRSAYGANKDSLTWKPWEKYQTNMEVGVVSESYLLNPSNPKQVISYGGMANITDNGIYSGVYIGPKAMIGTQTTEYIDFQDSTGIETFVMVVINNYDAAKDAKCVTQIKFAVTNGGVFSMEKRSTNPGTTSNFSKWEAVGGAKMYWNKDYQDFIIENPMMYDIRIGSGVIIGAGRDEFKDTSKIRIGDGAHIYPYTEIKKENGFISLSCDGTRSVNLGGWSEIGIYSELGPWAKIGGSVKIKATDNSKILWIGDVDTSEVSDDDYFIGGYLGRNAKISDGIKITSNGNQIFFEYNGKTAELQLT